VLSFGGRPVSQLISFGEPFRNFIHHSCNSPFFLYSWGNSLIAEILVPFASEYIEVIATGEPNMATFNGAPMDEIQWRLEAAVAHFGGIRAENIHLYFLASPFCDSASNNKALENQLRFQPDSFQTLQDRTAFEDALRRMNSGVEYIITDGPRKTTPDMNPVWVIRKQRRTKGMRSTDPREAPPPDRIDVLGTYYAVGENIYQAPSIIDILSNRLVSLVRN